MLVGCSSTKTSNADPLKVLQNKNARMNMNLSIDNIYFKISKGFNTIVNLYESSEVDRVGGPKSRKYI